MSVLAPVTQWERAMRDKFRWLELAAAVATLIMLAFATADWVLKFLA
jgi:hypothetical protein